MSTDAQQTGDGAAVAQATDTLSVTDNRTGKTYELEISDGTVRATDLRQIKVSEDDFGLMAYDPAFTNTASCRSAMRATSGASTNRCPPAASITMPSKMCSRSFSRTSRTWPISTPSDVHTGVPRGRTL